MEWGVEVTLVELKDIQLPESMKRAMARQAEAEREKRAKIIAAEGESLAAAALGEASDIMMAHPVALQLRNLQSLVEIGVDKNTTVVFPAPLMSTIQELGAFLSREQAAATTVPAAPTNGMGLAFLCEGIGLLIPYRPLSDFLLVAGLGFALISVVLWYWHPMAIRPRWMRNAACRGQGFDPWFPADEVGEGADAARRSAPAAVSAPSASTTPSSPASAMVCGAGSQPRNEPRWPAPRVQPATADAGLRYACGP